MRHAYCVFAEGGVKMDVKATPTSGFAGDPIRVIARLNRAKSPVRGAEIEVTADMPLVSVGDLLGKPTEPLGRKLLDGDPVSLVDQKLETLTAKGNHLKRGIQKFRLFDDGMHKDGEPNDGIYANVFEATKIPGSYGFRVIASGISAGRVQSTRESSFSVYCGVLPDPRHSEIEISRTGRSSFKLRVAPRDAAGHLIGPGHTIQGVLTTPDQRLPIQFTDGLDGSYTGDLVASHERQQEQVAWTFESTAVRSRQ